MTHLKRNVGLIVLLFVTLAAPAAPSETATDVISYTRLYADASGVTHFVDEEITLAGEKDFMTSPLTSATAVGHFLASPECDQDWHPAPRRQWVFILTGTIEVEAQDGEIRQFPSGSIVFVEDTSGKGHKTRVVGEESVLAAWVPVDSK